MSSSPGTPAFSGSGTGTFSSFSSLGSPEPGVGPAAARARDSSRRLAASTQACLLAALAAGTCEDERHRGAGKRVWAWTWTAAPPDPLPPLPLPPSPPPLGLGSGLAPPRCARRPPPLPPAHPHSPPPPPPAPPCDDASPIHTHDCMAAVTDWRADWEPEPPPPPAASRVSALLERSGVEWSGRWVLRCCQIHGTTIVHP